MTTDIAGHRALRPPCEILFADELAALKASDTGKKPEGWVLSPQAVRTFIVGSNEKKLSGQSLAVGRKFYGDDALIDRCIVTLLGNRGLLLVGEPGTAKSMLSELLAAAISGVSTKTIQGTAGTTEDQIKYSWNYAMLLAEGPKPAALVPSPMYTAMKQGLIVRFEEVTRCQPEIQDCLISIMSDKVLHVPELAGDAATLFAEKGFNVLATANIRDRGVHEMSSALKRRFNFETVNPISERKLEIKLVTEQTESLLREAGVPVTCPEDVMEVLVSTFQDLRSGAAVDGTVVERPSTVMSTAEAVAVGFSAGLEAHYFGAGTMDGSHIARQLLGTVLKDNPEDAKKLRQYFDVIVKARAKKSRAWQTYWDARKCLDR
ncbi:MAG TPA: AAA family ATPase [Pyrinomonadaceae bacterium]|nr:AAA family ATPase [Pyrinomonadaceae bacterium]